MRVFTFTAGLAVGYVLGARAGRDKYERVVAAAREVQNHPATVELQQMAKGLLGIATEPAAVQSGTSLAATSSAGRVSLPLDTESVSASPRASGRTARRRSSATPPPATGSSV